MDLFEVLGAQPPPDDSPEARRQREHAVRMHRAQADLEIAERQVLTANAWLFCKCKRRYSWDKPSPPQARCPVHGSFLMTPDGRVY